MEPYRPADVAKMLQVSASTVRNYATAFALHLSPGATVTGESRYFTDKDLTTLAFVAQQSRQGLPRSEITARLDAGELAAFDWQPPQDAPHGPTEPQGEPPPGQAMLVLVTQYASLLDTARDRERELTDRLIAAESRAARAEGQLETLQAAQTAAQTRPGFWRRLFGG